MLLLSNNKKERNRVSQLHDIINTISFAKDMKGFLELTLNKTLKALCSDRGSIFLTGDDGKELFLRWSYNYNMNGVLNGVTRKVGEGVAGKVAEDRKSLLVKDTENDSRSSNMYGDYKTNSFLCVPIATDMRLIGVMSITENKYKKPYSRKDLKFLEIVAGHIALKIERSHLLSQLEHFKKKTERDEKFADLGKFACGISHELNSPLDGVMRYVNLALSSLEDGVAREYLLEAKGGLSRIANIIRSLLELVRRKKASQAIRSIDVNKTIENCIELLRYEALSKAIDIKKDFSLDLPTIPDLGLESVFSNILKNAVDALDEKGSVSISTVLEDGFVKISISDTGCGIIKHNIDRIFEPFFSTKEVTQGAGLGLSICYDIVKRYKGKIDVLSEPGKGTKFIIYIPYHASIGIKHE